MYTFSFDAGREWFAKAQNGFADCLIRQIVPDSTHGRFRIGNVHAYVLSFRFQGVLLKLTKIIYYCTVFHANIFSHNDVPTKMAKTMFLFSCKIHS